MTNPAWAGAKRLVEGPRGIVILSLIGAVAALALTGVLFLPPNTPLRPISDHTDMLAVARAMLNGASIFFNHDLGFPFGADRYYFPRPNYWTLLTLWIGARVTNNVFGTIQFFYLVSIPLIFVCCFVSLLWLRIERLAAFMIALAYCLLPFTAARFSIHDYHMAYFAAPMAAALALHLGRVEPLASVKQAVMRNISTPFAVIAFMAIAWSDVYFVFFGAFFIGLSGFFLSAGNRRIEPLAVAVAQITIIAILVVIGSLPYLLHGTPFPIRAPSDQYLFAVRVPDFLHLFPEIKPLAGKYEAYVRSVRTTGEGDDFWPGKVLSFIVLAAPLIALAAAARQGPASPRLHLIGLAALLISAALLFALPESYGYLFNMLVTGTIRSQNRVGVFVAFFAFVILQSALDWRSGRWRYVSPLLLALLLVVNVWPSLGFAARVANATANNPTLQTDRASIASALAALHRADAQAVLQLPIAGWPEVPTIGNFAPYRHLLFYIYDAPQSPIRWSYGIDWHQPEYGRMLALGTALEAAPDRQTWMPFRCLGFDAVVIEKAAYAPETVLRIEKSLERAGIAKPLFDDERRGAFPLTALPHDPAACAQPAK